MSNTESLALFGGLVGGMLAAAVVGILVFYILLVVAFWKIFEKAGYAGWKSIIPIYNVYILCKIIGINFWIYVILIPFVAGIIDAIIFSGSENGALISSIYALVLDVYMSYKTAKVFDKGIGFTIGLLIFPNIFQLILGFGSAKYVGSDN